MKKAIATVTLALLLTLGASFAKANDGIIVFGQAAPSSDELSPCTGRTGIIVFGGRTINCDETDKPMATTDGTGIIVFGTGIIVFSTGIIVFG